MESLPLMFGVFIGNFIYYYFKERNFKKATAIGIIAAIVTGVLMQINFYCLKVKGE